MFSFYSKFVRIVCMRYKLARKNRGFTVLYISRHTDIVPRLLVSYIFKVFRRLSCFNKQLSSIGQKFLHTKRTYVRVYTGTNL
jgi:hypothetical protein